MYTSETDKSSRAEGGPALWLDRAITFWLFALAASAPHSIAATQFSWGCGLVLWGARLLLRPRPRPAFGGPVLYALLAFFAWTVLSSLLSYDRATSVGKLRAASLFTIVFLVASNVHTRRVLRLLALVLIASCMVNVLYTFGERIVGRGIRLEGVAYSTIVLTLDTYSHVLPTMQEKATARLEKMLYAESA